MFDQRERLHRISVATSQRGVLTRVAAADEDPGSSDQDDLPEFFCLDFYQAAGRSVADARWFNTYLQGVTSFSRSLRAALRARANEADPEWKISCCQQL